MVPSNNQFHSLALTGPTPLRFGTFLKFLRHRHRIKQKEVMTHLPTWTEESYSRLENGELFPAFDQLVPIACALEHAGVQWSPSDRQQFLTLAREKIEAKKTYKERKTEQEWDELRLRLARVSWDTQEHQHTAPTLWRVASPPRLLETRHLVGREEWLAAVLACMQHDLPKKLLILQGPVGIGKSSELHRLALHALDADPRPQVLLCELPPVERESGPESALDLLLATLLVEAGPPDTAILAAPLEARMTFALTWLEKTARAVLLLVDNAEQALDEQGQLSGCWQRFLSGFLRSQHRACLVLATKEWPGWSEGERVFVAEYIVPSLSVEAGAQVLEQLGLASVASKHLRRVSQVVGGVPLCLEWVASLVQEPLLGQDWQGILEDAGAQMQQEARHREVLTRRLLHLLKDPSLFGGHVAAKLTPLLERVMQKRLSAETIQLLNVLSLANIALGKPAVQSVCSHPGLLKELRDASLLMPYSQHVQVLPMVASLVRSRLSPVHQQQGEEHLIDAFTRWLHEGKASERDLGAIIAELARLYLMQHRLLEAAQLLIRYGWMSFNQGYAPRLARCATEVMESFDWHTTEENECGGLLLHYHLTSFLGKAIDDRKRAADYQNILEAVLTEKMALWPSVEVAIVYRLMTHAIHKLHFEEAQSILEACSSRLEIHCRSDIDLRISLLEKRAWLIGAWYEYKEEQGDIQSARELQKQVIILYRQYIALFPNDQEQVPPHTRSLLKKRLARALNNLGYHLNRTGQYEEALQVMDQSIALKEQGYVEFDTLADAYGEKSESLSGFGRFQEALLFDEKALTEVQRLINTRYPFSQDELRIYCINRGRLYLRLGRIEEAEQLLREATLGYIHPGRRMYRMFAEEALGEIKQWRQQATSPHYQLDWRWVERYRELASFDSYWWLAPAGPFTEEEQQQWDSLFTPVLDQTRKERLAPLIVQSQQRECEDAIAQQREPRLHYPALDIQDVRRRLADLLQLDTEIGQQESNPVVRRLYHDTIQEELDFLHMIEATYLGNSQTYWECNLRLNPAPTSEEMDYAFSRVRRLLLQGLLHPRTAQASQSVIQFLQEQLHLSLDLSATQAEAQELLQEPPLSPPQMRRMVSAQTAQRFFEAVLRESGYEDWRVIIDPSAHAPHIEQGLRQLFLPESKLSINEVKDYLLHELAIHVSRCVAGERSLLGLLGIHTKNSLETEEGLAIYYEREAASLHGQPFDESGMWLGTLATGLASGVITPPQTFLSLFTFFERFILLYRLVKRPDQSVQMAKQQARKLALARCLRTYRGVPHLERAGVCYVKDALYLRGLWKIEHAVAQDATVLDRFAVGVVALESLPTMQELGIVSSAQPLKERALDPQLDSYIVAFEVPEGLSNNHT